MMVDTEVVVEEDTTEIADHHLTTKADHAMTDHVHVLTLPVSSKRIFITILDISTLSGNPVFFF